MRQLKINVSYLVKYIFLFLLIIPFIGISNFQRIAQLNKLSFLSSLANILWYSNICIIAIYVLYIFMHTRKFLSVSCFLMVCIFSFLFVRTLLARASTGEGSGLRNLITFILLVIFGELYIFKKKENFLAFVDVVNTFIFLNFLFIIRYIGQGGLVYWSVREQRIWKGYYLLGYDNGFIIFIMPLACFCLILYRQTANKKYIVMLMIQLVSEIVIKSAATSIALACFVMLTLLQNNKMIVKLVYKPLNIFLLYFACFFGFVVLKFQYIIDRGIYLLFKKGLDTTRWRLWNEGLDKIEKSWLYGYGYRTETFGNNFLTPHNMFLEWMTQGGVIEFAGFLLLFYISLNQLYKHIDSYSAKVLFNGIIALMFAYMAEGYSIHISYWLVLLVLLASSRIGQLNYILSDRSM